MGSHRLTVISSILGPQRLSIVLPDRIVPVQMRASRIGPGQPLFSFATDGAYVVTGSRCAPWGLLYRGECQIATLQPYFISTRKRLTFCSQSIKVFELNYESQSFPISCSLWMGFVGTNFTLRAPNGRHLAFWKRRNAKTRILISASVPSELCDVIIGAVLYTEVEKNASC